MYAFECLESYVLNLVLRHYNTIQMRQNTCADDVRKAYIAVTNQVARVDVLHMGPKTSSTLDPSFKLTGNA